MNSVPRQVNFNWTKIDGKCPNWIREMRHFWWFSNTVIQGDSKYPIAVNRVIPFSCWAFKLIQKSIELVKQHQIVLLWKLHESRTFHYVRLLLLIREYAPKSNSIVAHHPIQIPAYLSRKGLSSISLMMLEIKAIYRSHPPIS